MSHETASSRIESLISAERIAVRVRELGDTITRDYEGRELILVGVLKGAWVFLADLVRELRVAVSCEFVRVSSYGMGTETSGQPQLLLDVASSLAGKHVLVVDDILDTGISLAWLLEHLQRQAPASLRVCVLLDKPSRRRVDITADYVGFEIPDVFVVGYGIDWAERYRELPYVGGVKTDD
jgi:hypoxanthine phosphoribosyltransferase